MATIINNPDSNGSSDGGGGMGMIIGAIVLVIIIAIFFIYGLPAMRNGADSGTDVNVPDSIDVNVDTPTGGTGTGQ